MTEIKLDYDVSVPRDLFYRVRLVAQVHKLRVVCVSVRRTRRGWHVIVTCGGRPVSFQRLVCIQALLGSDWKRELFNSRRALAWRHIPAFWRTRANVLYSRHYHGVAL